MAESESMKEQKGRNKISQNWGWGRNKGLRPKYLPLLEDYRSVTFCDYGRFKEQYFINGWTFLDTFGQPDTTGKPVFGE